MIDLYIPQEVRAMDRRAVAAGTPSLVLMERAATHLARAVVDAGGRGYGLRVGILCGKGSNGGDGLAAARLLLDLGAHPRVFVVPGTDALEGDAAVQRDRFRRRGGRLAETAAAALRHVDVAVDALLGTGATGPPRGAYPAAIAALTACAAPVVACDLPSGVDAATGGVPGPAVRADTTVTFGAHKVGLWLWPARGHCGRLVLGDIGLADDGTRAPAALALEPTDVARLLPAPPRDAEKRSTGVVVVLAGSPGMSGAATLVARGALAAGAGLVTIATSATVRDVVAAAVPEALTLDLPDDDAEAAHDRLCERLDAADALAVGPGLGHDPATVALVRRLVREVRVPLVLDADGVNAFRGEGDLLADHKSRLLVLTPHERELGRIVFGDAAAVWRDRLLEVPHHAELWGAVVVAKGPGSLIAAPGGRCFVNPTGSGALASGGTGDVLTGMTATVVAQDATPDAVAAAVWVHGLAGELAGERAHPRSVTAMDVAAAVPAALRRVEAEASAQPTKGRDRR